MTGDATPALWHCLLGALQNERCLDLRYRQGMAPGAAAGLPNYKVMKQVALRGRLGAAYRPFIAIAVAAVPLLALAQWLRAIAGSLRRPDVGTEARGHIVATTPTNIELIRSALPDPTDFEVLRPGSLPSRIGLGEVLRCIAEHTRLLGWIGARERGRRADLILHSRDAFALVMLTRYVRMRPDHRFATDDHYQRWAYLLSRNSSRLYIVQHGFLDEAIRFEIPFGSVNHLYVRDESFVPIFAKYYALQAWSVFAPLPSLRALSSTNALFLASSFPSIDAEIQLVKSIRERCAAPIIVKLHPSHRYDQRGQALVALASEVVAGSTYPACRVFVSHSSFMEFDYRALGIPTVSIARAGGADQAAAEVLALLEAVAAPSLSAA